MACVYRSSWWAAKLILFLNHVLFLTNNTPDKWTSSYAWIGTIINWMPWRLKHLSERCGIPEIISCRITTRGIFELSKTYHGQILAAKFGMTQVTTASVILKEKGEPRLWGFTLFPSIQYRDPSHPELASAFFLNSGCRPRKSWVFR